jgi:hypothetical protein
VQSETAQDVNKQQDIMEVQERTCGLVRNNVNDRDFVQHNPLTPTGFERVSTTTISAKDLGQTSLSSAAKSGAILTETDFSDQRLCDLVSAWPQLPEAVRAGIAAMVKAASPRNRTSKKKGAQ